MKWLENLRWDGSDTFNNVDFNLWNNSANQPAGYYKQYFENKKHVELRLINKAGHQVGYY